MAARDSEDTNRRANDPPRHPHGPSGGDARWRWLACVLAAACLLLPLLSARILPLADLPQQLAQMRLLDDALGDGESGLRVQWLAPNRLSYLLLWIGWRVGDPFAAATVAISLLALFWVGGTHLLAARRTRSLAAALLASVFFFNHVFYWGFFNFIAGWPCFVLWVLALRRDPSERPPGRELGLTLALALLLYAAHILWLGAGIFWYLLHHLRRRYAFAAAWPRLAGIAPVLVLALLAYQSFVGSGFRSMSFYGALPWERLAPARLVDEVLGGLTGWLEPVVLVLLLAWLLLGLWQSRRRLGAALDPDLLLAAGTLAFLGLTLPHLYNATMSLAERWFPFAAVLLLLALPAPRLLRLPRRLLAGLVLAGFTLVTAATWRTLNSTELRGLEQTLATLPARSRLISLIFTESEHLKVLRPYLHVGAYAQLLHGGELDFSFADVPTSLVVYEPPRAKGWTPELEWNPRRIETRDFGYFTHALIAGDAPIQRRFSAAPFLRAAAGEGEWRLYRVALEGSAP